MLFLLLSFCYVVAAVAQNSAPFTFKATTKPSKCNSDGEIKVEISNDYAPKYLNPQYSVLQTNPPQGVAPTKKDFQNQSEFSALPAGNYTVSVRLEVAGSGGTKQEVFQFTNVIVDADYEPIKGKFVALTFGFDQTYSVPSFKDCGTGQIYLSISGSRANKDSNLTITMRKQGEPQSAERQVNFERNPENKSSFKLEGDNYLPGKYIVKIHDGCNYSEQTIELPAITNLPTFRNEGTYKSNGKPNGENMLTNGYKDKEGNPISSRCDAPLLKLELVDKFVTSKEYSSYKAKMFEIALAPKGVEPAADQYVTLDINRAEKDKRYQHISYYNLPLGRDGSGRPRLISDFYNGELEATVRLKHCPTNKRKFTVFVAGPNITVEQEDVNSPRIYDECGKVSRMIKFAEHKHIYCYPIKITVTAQDGSETITQEVRNKNLDYKGHMEDLAKIKVLLNKKYDYSFVDANGKELQSKSLGHIGHMEQHRVDTLSAEVVRCGEKYVLPFKFRSMEPCYPYIVEVTKAGGTMMGSYQINTPEEAKAFIRSMELEFGVEYTFTAKKDNVEMHSFTYKREFDLKPKSISINVGKARDYCLRDQGTLNVMFNRQYLEDKTVVVKDDKGNEIGRATTKLDPKTQNQYNKPDVDVDDLVMPPGNYTLEVTIASCTYTHPFVWKGFYNRENFDYTRKRVCNGVEIMPVGVVTKGGVQSPADTYFRVIAGPSGGYTPADVVRGNETNPTKKKLLLTKAGVYLLGILPHAYQKACALDTIEINVIIDGLKTSPADESAYACGGTGSIGHIFTKAVGGVPPYKYELYDNNNNPILVGGTALEPVGYVGAGSDIVHFEYGSVGETYKVKVTDACKNSMMQSLTIVDLSNFPFVKAPETTVCAGDVIYITTDRALNNYRWYPPGKNAIDNPNDFISEKRELYIFNARVEDSGRYECEVRPLGCGTGLRSDVYITVVPCTAPVNPHLMQRVQRPTAP